VNYRIIESKYTGFHVNLRALFVDEINGRTTGFGGAEFDFRVYLTVPSGKAGPSVKPLASLHNSDSASTRPGPVSRMSSARP